MSAESESADRPVIVVGGGFSGTMVAAQLARRGVASVLVEKARRVGKGIAYATDDPAHLLNVPAAKMSAWPERPDDFAEAVAAAGIGDGGNFAPRMAFGHYLRAILDEAEASGLVTVVAGEAVAARRDGAGWAVTLGDGRALAGSALVLASGNQPPQPLGIAGPVIDDPWSRAGRAAVEALAGSEAPVLLVGTGLTMVDLVLTLDEVGHEGPVTALSRRGLVPRAHAPGVTPLPPPALEEVPASLSAMVGWLRARGTGVDWRSAVDSLRPVSQALWASWPEATRRRFLRHARPWWDVHRHRIAPSVAEWIREDVARGKLDVVAGRIAGVEDEGALARVRIARRDGRMAERRVAAIVNCTGPLGAIGNTRDPLIRQMLGDGLVVADAVGIGLEADADDQAGEGLWVVGPLSKGRWWEITAVPDIRGQVQRIAEKITISVKNS